MKFEHREEYNYGKWDQNYKDVPPAIDSNEWLSILKQVNNNSILDNSDVVKNEFAKVQGSLPLAGIGDYQLPPAQDPFGEILANLGTAGGKIAGGLGAIGGPVGGGVSNFLSNLGKEYNTVTEQTPYGKLSYEAPSPWLDIIRTMANYGDPQGIGNMLNKDVEAKTKAKTENKELLKTLFEKRSAVKNELNKLQTEMTPESWNKFVDSGYVDYGALTKKDNASSRTIQIRPYDVGGKTLLTKLNSKTGESFDMNMNPIKIPEDAKPLGRTTYNPVTGEEGYLAYPDTITTPDKKDDGQKDLLDKELENSGITPTPKIKMDVIKTMTENRQKKEYIAASTGVESINKALAMFDKNPDIYKDFINRTLGREEAGKLEAEIKNAQDVIVRLRTGAALNRDEVAYYDKLFSPNWYNDKENARYKMELLKNILEESKNRLERPYWIKTEIQKLDVLGLGNESSSGKIPVNTAGSSKENPAPYTKDFKDGWAKNAKGEVGFFKNGVLQ